MTNPGQPGQPFPPQGAPQPGQPFPPQGGQPFPPQGAPQPGQPYPQPGGPGFGGGASPFGGPGQPAPAPKSGKGKKIGGIVGAVAIAGGIAAFRLVDFGAPDVGDCIETTGASDFDTVDCGDSAAELRVVGIEEEELTEDEFFADPDTCADFASATDALWRQGSFGDEGTVYCFEPVA